MWDKPALIDSGTEGAIAFIDAMNLSQFEAEDDNDPLVIAGHAILSEAMGEPAAAIAARIRLEESDDSLVRLLGGCLRCWSHLDPDPLAIGEVQAQIAAIHDAEFRARLTTKLIAAAFEHGWDETLPDLFAQARDWAPPGSMLKAMIESEGFNLLNWDFPSTHGSPPDPLTAYQWIQDLQADAAESALIEGVERRARSPWRLTLNFGGGNLNKPVAAEMQARWAGALWLRRSVQVQLAAHLLNGGAGDPSQFASAVTLWALSNHRHTLEDVIEYAEPNFDGESADFLISHLSRSSDVALRFNDRLLEAAIGCWDLMSPSVAVSLLDRFEPTPGDHPAQRRVATLWSILSLRVPDEWAARFGELSDDAAAALLDTTTPAVAKRLPKDSAERLLSLAKVGSLDESGVVLTAVLSERLSGGQSLVLDPDASAVAIVRVASAVDRPLSPGLLTRAIGDLSNALQREIYDASRGKAGIGSYRPLPEMSRGVIALGDVPQGVLKLVTDAATDDSIPRNLRYDATKALTNWVAHGSLDPSRLDGFPASVPESGAEAFWDEYSRPLMRAAKAGLSMALGDVEANLPLVLTLSRDAEVRVRLDAISATILGRRLNNDEMLESILLSGLFDPHPDVVDLALFGFSETAPTRPPTQAAVRGRLGELFASGSRDVRKSVAHFAMSSSAPEREMDVIREAASTDRSFAVREIVLGLTS